jgi:hypothetical protein
VLDKVVDVSALHTSHPSKGQKVAANICQL